MKVTGFTRSHLVHVAWLSARGSNNPRRTYHELMSLMRGLFETGRRTQP